MRERKMRALFLVLMFVLLSSTSLKADDAAAKSEDVKKLIVELPSAKNLKRELKVLRDKKSSEEDKKSAKEYIEKAKKIVPKLKKIIKVGTSVFDYPGLIAKGNISFHKHSNEYSLYIGIYLLGHEGSAPYDFRVRFDVKGIIKSIDEVVWKH